MRRSTWICLWLAGSLAATASPAAAQEERPGVSRVSLEYEHTRFDSNLNPWNLVALELSRRTGLGTLVLRGNLADRFDRTGRQVEVDAYPRLAPGVYGYLNVGHSATELFPEWRYGAELFGSAGRGVELSAGVRHLDFRSSDVTIYTGSAGIYRGNYYLVARPFVTPRDRGTSVSGSVMLRRYLRDAREHLSLRVGGGATPAETFTEAELERLGSVRARVEGKRRLGSAWYGGLTAGYEREELATGDRRGRLTVGVELDHYFR